jgi:uncharacterized protein (DUF58 family)
VVVPGVLRKVWTGPGAPPPPLPTPRQKRAVFENPDTPWARVVNRRYHFSAAGAAYVVTTMVMIVGAINGQNNLLFWLFGLGVAGLLVSGILSGSPLMGLRVRREAPAVGTVGQPLRVRYTLRSAKWIMPAFALVVEEVESARRWLGATHTAGWMGVLPRPAADVAYLAPRATLSVEAVVTPTRRGLAVLLPLRVSSSFPFGITRKSVAFADEHRVLVRPRPAEVPNELLRARGGVGVTTGSLTPSRTGMEFYSLRDYQPGDAVRAVAWRATARLDRPIVRTFATPPGERVWVVLDCAGATAGEVESVVSIAAGLATRAVTMGLDVGLLGPDQRVLEPMRSGRRQVDQVLDRLALFDAATPSEGGEPVWALSRAIVVHAGTAPHVHTPVPATAVSSRDPRVRVHDDESAANAQTAKRGWWGFLLGLLGDSPAADTRKEGAP